MSKKQPHTEKFAPKAATGISFDDVIAKAMRVQPEKPKKVSRPRKAAIKKRPSA